MYKPFIVTTNEIVFEAVEYDSTRLLESHIGQGREIIISDNRGHKAAVIFNPDHVKYVGVQL